MSNKKVCGFSLLEVMIGLAIGLILLVGIFDVFNAARSNFRYTQGLGVIQENGQLASYLLTRDLSQAGYVGCRKIDGSFEVSSHVGLAIEPAMLIHGYNQQSIPSNEKAITKNMVADSSVVAIQFMNTETVNLLTPVSEDASWLKVSAGSRFQVGDEVLVADCQHADVVALTAVDKQAIETNVTLHDYPAGTQIGQWRDEWFYVGKTGRFNNVGQAVTALYMHQPNGRDEELVDNVADMHVQYGYATEAGELRFVTASKVTDWAMVKAVRVMLLLSSGEQMLSQPQTVIFDGFAWQASDRQLYRQWEVVVGLMNR